MSLVVPVLVPGQGQPRAGAFDDVQYTDRLNLAMPGYLNLALVEQLNSNMVILDRAVVLDPDGSIGGVTLVSPILDTPVIADFSQAQHGHLDGPGGGQLGGDAITAQITGTGLVVKQSGAVLVSPTLTQPEADALAINGDLSGPRRVDWRTAEAQRWSLYAAGGSEPGGDQGSDLNLTYYTDAGALKGTAMALRRTDGRVSFPHDVQIGGGLTVTGAVSMPNLDVSSQVNAGIAAHVALPDPHSQYLTPAEASVAYAPLSHTTALDPHSQYLTQSEADPLYLASSWAGQHLAATDPHPSYLNQGEADQLYAPLSWTTAPDPFPQYVTVADGNALWLPLSHEPGVDPHPQYTTEADVQNYLATNGHFVNPYPDPMVFEDTVTVQDRLLEISGDAGNTLEWRADGFFSSASGSGETGDYLPLTGGTLTGNLTITSPSGNGSVYLSGSAETLRGVGFQTNLVPRWDIGSYGANTGANAGDDFYFARRNDAGADIQPYALVLSRATGAAAFGGNLAVGVAPDPWGSYFKAVQVGGSSAFIGAAGPEAYLVNNAYWNGAAWISSTALGATRLGFYNGEFIFDTDAPGGAGGRTLNFTPKLRIAATGAATFGGAVTVAIGGTNRLRLEDAGADGGRLNAPTGNLELYGGSGFVVPYSDGGNYFGAASRRWINIFTNAVDVAGKPVAVSPAAGNALTWDATGFWAPAGMSQAAADLLYLPLTGGTLSGLLNVQRGLTSDLALSVRLGAEANPRWRVRTDGAVGWGPGGATAEDTYLYRLGAAQLRLDSHLAVGIAPAAWLLNNYRVLQVGSSGSLHSGATVTLGTTYLSNNTYIDAGGDKAQYTGSAARLAVGVSGGVQIQTAGSATQANPQSFTTKLTVSNLGLLTLAPASGDAVSAAGGVMPGTTNTYDLGTLSLRWGSLFLGTALGIAGASATANQITTAITTDAQPRLIIDGNGKLRWGPGASTAQDTSLERVGAGVLRVDNHLGVGATPETGWSTTYPAVRIGQRGAAWADKFGTGVWLTDNTYYDGSNRRAIAAAGGSQVGVQGGMVILSTAASVGAAAAQTMTPRVQVQTTGNVTFSPDAGVAAITIGSAPQPKVSVQSSAPSSPMVGDLWVW